MDRTLIEKHMRILGISEEEAIQLIKDDIEIDKMASIKQVNSDLTEEQQKVIKKARQGERKQTVYKFDTSKRKKVENLDKRAIIDTMREALARMGCVDFEITNPEREFIFFNSGVKYKITLACPRK